MRYWTPLLTGISFIAAAGWPISAQVGGINITGIVTDANGAALPNAKVALAGRKLTTTTDSEGRYAFKVQPTFARELPAMAAGPAPVSASGRSLRLSVRESSRLVRIDLHTLSGSRIGEVLSANLAPGDYLVNPFPERAHPGLHLVRVRMGGTAYTLKLENLAMADRSTADRGSAGFGSSRPALLKPATAQDTLSVIAVGFERGERAVEILTGTQDFRLPALKYANVPYKSGNISAAERSACILDVRTPKTGSRWPVVIHLHGGGMTGGDRNEAFGSQYNNFGTKFLEAGVIEVSPGYRLIGAGTWPDYIRDAAAAAVWVYRNIETYGGDPNSVFISGFSAGAYLTHMLAIDSTWFKAIGFDPHRFAGFVSMSGQTRQHENIRQDLKVSNIMAEKPYAMPMGNIRKTDIPWQIFVGGDEGGTVTDNKAMYDALIARGSANLHMDVIPGQPHTCADMGNATSVKRDKFLAFIARYRAR